MNAPSLLTAVEILRCYGHKNFQVAVQENYIQMACNRLGVYLAKLMEKDQCNANQLIKTLEASPDQLVRDWIVLPEITYHLFYRFDDFERTKSFLHESLSAQWVLRGLPCHSASLTWSASGESFIESQIELANDLQRPRILCDRIMGIPVDFISPFALKIPIRNLDIAEIGDEEIDLFTGSELKAALNNISDACDLILSVDASVGHFVSEFTKVLVLRKDSKDPNSFVSGSSGQYVGRSLIVNAHQDHFAGAVLTDGIIHESIHSLLYMLERHRLWVLKEDLYLDRSATVMSPWSGRLLKLRPFLQACFVWFGLLNFWNLPKAAEVFGNQTSQWFAARARDGFLRGKLMDLVERFLPNLDHELCTAIDTIQRLVIDDGTG